MWRNCVWTIHTCTHDSVFHTVHNMSRHSYDIIYISLSLYICTWWYTVYIYIYTHTYCSIYVYIYNVDRYCVYANFYTHVGMHISYNLDLASCTLCTFIFVCHVLTQDLLASEQKVSAEPDVKVLQVLCMPPCAERDAVVCSFQPLSTVFLQFVLQASDVFWWVFDIFGAV